MACALDINVALIVFALLGRLLGCRTSGCVGMRRGKKVTETGRKTTSPRIRPLSASASVPRNWTALERHHLLRKPPTIWFPRDTTSDIQHKQ